MYWNWSDIPVTDSLDLSDYILDQHDGLKDHLLVTGKIMAQLFQEAGEWEVTRLHFFMGWSEVPVQLKYW